MEEALLHAWSGEEKHTLSGLSPSLQTLCRLCPWDQRLRVYVCVCVCKNVCARVLTCVCVRVWVSLCVCVCMCVFCQICQVDFTTSHYSSFMFVVLVPVCGKQHV